MRLTTPLPGLTLLTLLALSSPAADPSRPATRPAQAPVALHPDNPRYLLFRGKPLVLVSASEHYGSVV